MADKTDDEVPEETPGFKAPAQKPLQEIIEQDKEDESLAKYKQLLLGDAALGATIDKPRPNDPRNVIVTKLAIIVEGRDPVELDLEEDLKYTTIIIKEGAEYRVSLSFFVQNEIVAGLKYFQAVFRKGIRLGKDQFMVGSYGPKAEAHNYITNKAEEAPTGMLARGTYSVKSKFLDDDRNVIHEWEWTFKISKSWDASD